MFRTFADSFDSLQATVTPRHREQGKGKKRQRSAFTCVYICQTCSRPKMSRKTCRPQCSHMNCLRYRKKKYKSSSMITDPSSDEFRPRPLRTPHFALLTGLRLAKENNNLWCGCDKENFVPIFANLEPTVWLVFDFPNLRLSIAAWLGRLSTLRRFGHRKAKAR